MPLFFNALTPRVLGLPVLGATSLTDLRFANPYKILKNFFIMVELYMPFYRN